MSTTEIGDYFEELTRKVVTEIYGIQTELSEEADFASSDNVLFEVKSTKQRRIRFNYQQYLKYLYSKKTVYYAFCRCIRVKGEVTKESLDKCARSIWLIPIDVLESIQLPAKKRNGEEVLEIKFTELEKLKQQTVILESEIVFIIERQEEK